MVKCIDSWADNSDYPKNCQDNNGRLFVLVYIFPNVGWLSIAIQEARRKIYKHPKVNQIKPRRYGNYTAKLADISVAKNTTRSTGPVLVLLSIILFKIDILFIFFIDNKIIFHFV